MKLRRTNRASNAEANSAFRIPHSAACRAVAHRKWHCGVVVPQSGAKAIRPRRNFSEGGFTLMEVMIAIAVFCIGVFAILGLVASVMRDARLLNKPMVDAGVVASQIAQTNSLIEVQGTSGDLSEFLGDNYKGYAYVYGIYEVESNHLYRADIAVTSDTPGKPVLSKMSVLFFAPQSPPGSLDFGYMQH